MAETINITPYYTYSSTRHAIFAARSQYGPFFVASLLSHTPVSGRFRTVHPWLFDDAFLIE